MSDRTVEFHKDSRGREPEADSIDTLTIGSQAKALRLIDLLAQYGVLLHGSLKKTAKTPTEHYRACREKNE